MITFIRPKDNKQPPNFANFKVPLKFNKLDLRDYLYNVYGVRTFGIRSQLRQQRVRRSKVHGRITRPPPIKTMTAELARPFVWPARPTGAALDPWIPEREARRDAAIRRQQAQQRFIQKTGNMPLRDENRLSDSRLSLRGEARRLLQEGGWSNHRDLDPRFAGQEEELARLSKVEEEPRKKKKKLVRAPIKKKGTRYVKQRRQTRTKVDRNGPKGTNDEK